MIKYDFFLFKKKVLFHSPQRTEKAKTGIPSLQGFMSKKTQKTAGKSRGRGGGQAGETFLGGFNHL